MKRGTGKITINGKDQSVYFARPVLRMMINQPLEAGRARNRIRRRLHRGRLGPFGPGRRGSSRHRPGAGSLRAGAAPGHEAGEVPDARPARRRAEEVRPRESPTVLPVLEALGRIVSVFWKGASGNRSALSLCLLPARDQRSCPPPQSSSMAKPAPPACRSASGWSAAMISSCCLDRSRQAQGCGRARRAAERRRCGDPVPAGRCGARGRGPDHQSQSEGDRRLDRASRRAGLGLWLSGNGGRASRGDPGGEADRQSGLLSHGLHRAGGAAGAGGARAGGLSADASMRSPATAAAARG